MSNQPAHDTFTDLVLAHAAELGDQPAYLFLRENETGSDADAMSYRTLDRTAKRIASWLQSIGAQRRQVLLLYPSGPAFVAAFLGCLYAGAVAVPAPLPSEQGKHFSRVNAILRDAEVRAVLTDAANGPDVAQWLRDCGCSGIAHLATDQVDGEAGDPDAWRRPAITADDLAFLQYTSGSTSQPKGVMVSHRNLLANEWAIANSMSTSRESVVGGWLPLYHDMGLIGHMLHPLWLGTSAVLMSPTAFLRRPHRWLESIGRYHVTVGGGPNFAFDQCVRRISDEQLAALDLSSWTNACNGAEPVRAETIRDFSERFAPAGFDPAAFTPCYGMAETTLLVSSSPPRTVPVTRVADAGALERGTLSRPGPGAASRTLVSSGVVRDFDVRIVDPDLKVELADDTVGEIWVKGDSVARGYWKRPQVNEEIFNAKLRLVRGGTDPGWLRTGDLGLRNAGELFVTGRLKELIVISGRNLYPHDIERAVQRFDPALTTGGGAAFAVDSGTEHLVLVQEVKQREPSALDLPALLKRVQTFLSREFNVPAGNVVLVRSGTIRRTTSGKIQRTAMRAQFLDGRLEPAAQVLAPAVAALLPPSAPADVLAKIA